MPNKFNLPKMNVEKPATPKKRHWLRNLIIFHITTLLIFIGMFAFLVNAFFDTHTLNFQAPIIVKVQSPVLIEKKTIISPIGSTSASMGFVKSAYAEEVKNPFDPKSPKGIAWELNKTKFGVEHWGALDELITNESGWNPFARNKNSGACGIGQALPCEKMECESWDYACQAEWTLDYIENRYKNPTNALTHWLEAKPINGKTVGNWY